MKRKKITGLTVIFLQHFSLMMKKDEKSRINYRQIDDYFLNLMKTFNYVTWSISAREIGS